MRYQARTNLNVNGQVVTYRDVALLDETSEVAELVVAGLLIAEDAEGNFPEPIEVPRSCCGRR